MNKIHISVSGPRISAKSEEAIVARSVNTVLFDAVFGPEWEGYEKTITFTATGCLDVKSITVIYGGGEEQVPWEVLQNTGALYISATGIAPNKLRPTAYMEEPLRIVKNGDMEAEPPDEYTKALWEQAVEKAAEAAQNAAEAENAAFASKNSAEESAKEAKRDAEIAKEAKNSMIFVTFDVDEKGHVVVKNSELLGSTEFALNNNGHMEVTL